MSVEAVNESLYGGFVDMSDVGGRLTGLETLEDHRWVDKPECVNHNLALNRLNGVDNDGN